MADYDVARRNMVNSQIRTNGVIDQPVIDAMLSVPREHFLPPSRRPVAYVDEDLPLGNGRFLMEPLVFANLLQMAHIDSTESVLIIGCLRAYSAAVLTKLAASVVGVESDPALVRIANQTLSEFAFDNATVVEGPLAAGLPSQAPYDVILIEGGVQEIPKALFDQLADDGRLATVVDDQGIGRGTLFTKRAGLIGKQVMFDAAVPPLPDFQVAPRFVF